MKDFNRSAKIAILYHIFYEDSLPDILIELEALKRYNTIFLFNICSTTPGKTKIANSLKKEFPECMTIFSSNVGKDIGAKLLLIYALQTLEIKCEYLIFLHDKKSLQALTGKIWKQELLKIISIDSIKSSIEYFAKNPRCGIIGSKKYILKEEYKQGNFTSINGNIMKELVTKHYLNPPTFEYVAGTMFWVRAEPLLDFFCKYPPLEIRRSLEKGNVLDNNVGTVTHSWERLLSWIVTSRNYTIYGL